MNDLETSRELGAIGARLDGHDAALKELKDGQEAGFKAMSEKLDSLRSSEDKRRGAAWVLSLFAGSGLLVSIADILFHRSGGK